MKSSYYLILTIICFSTFVKAQDEAGVTPDTASTGGTFVGIVEDRMFENTTAGEFTPGKGFTLFKTELASLNISVYGLARYINQMPGNQSFDDHLNRTRDGDTRNDIWWHRTFVWVSGILLYTKIKIHCIGLGIGSYKPGTDLWKPPDTLLVLPLRWSRDSTEFRNPFNAGTMAILFIQRPCTGRRIFQTRIYLRSLDNGRTSCQSSGIGLMVGNNLSQLGVTASQLTRELSTSASVWWMPTTGEFGPRGGYGDFEMHQEFATRFGASFVHAREESSISGWYSVWRDSGKII